MKLNISSALMGIAMGAMVLTGCQAEMNAPGLEIPETSLQANTTILDLKLNSGFYKTDDNYGIKVGNKTEAVVDPETGKEITPAEHYIIRGRITSSDASGNIYQTMYIQDETASIPIGVRLQSYYNEWRLGQEVVIDVTGLYIGKYAGVLQLGKYELYNGAGEVTFMSPEMLLERMHKVGLPNPETVYASYGSPYPADKMYCVTFNGLQQLPTDPKKVVELQGQLVEFRNVQWMEPGMPYATYHENVTRNLTDGTSSLGVRSSGYSNFWTTLTPEGVGAVRGELGYYNGSWQLTLRDINDVIFEGKGDFSDPYTIEEALAPVNDGTTGWVKGFIVGAVKPGVSAVASNNDIDWGANVDSDDTLVIAPDAECTDYTECMVVMLPAGSAMRNFLNLMDNPANIYAELIVNGQFAKIVGMGGVTPASGSEDEYSLIKAAAPPVQTSGDGTEAKPYTIDDVLALAPTFTANDVWVEGYIVGYIDGSSMSDAVLSGSTASASSYSNHNLLLGPTTTVNNAAQTVPVKLKVGAAIRNQLGLTANPSAYLKHVKLKGNLKSGYGVLCLDGCSTYQEL